MNSSPNKNYYLASSDWNIKTIAQIAETYAGGTPSRNINSMFGGSISWVKSAELNQKEIVETEEQLTELGYRSSSAKWVPENTPLIAMYGATAGVVSWLKINAVTNQAVLAVLPRSQEIDARWLYWILNFHSNHLLASVQGSGQPNLNKSLIDALQVPQPCLTEQKLIAEILDTIDEAIAHTSSIIAKLKQIKAGLLHDLLTRGLDENGELRDAITHPEQFKDSHLGQIPKDWSVLSVGQCIAKIEQGWSPDCESISASIGEWGVLKTTSVVWEGYQDFENKRLPSHLQPIPSYEVKPGDVLMTRAGPSSRVGVVALVSQTQGKLMLSDKLYRLTPCNDIKPDFLTYTLSGTRTQSYLSRLKTGLAESQTNISQAIVRTLLITIPSLEEQKRIIALLDAQDTRIQNEEAYRDKLQLHKKGLMNDLLTGRIRVNTFHKIST